MHKPQLHQPLKKLLHLNSSLNWYNHTLNSVNFIILEKYFSLSYIHNDIKPRIQLEGNISKEQTSQLEISFFRAMTTT